MFHTNLHEDEYDNFPLWPGQHEWELTMNELVDQGFFLPWKSPKLVFHWLTGAFGHTSEQMDSIKFLDLHVPTCVVDLIKLYVGVHSEALLKSWSMRKYHPRYYLYPFVGDCLYHQNAPVKPTFVDQRQMVRLRLFCYGIFVNTS